MTAPAAPDVGEIAAKLTEAQRFDRLVTTGCALVFVSRHPLKMLDRFAEVHSPSDAGNGSGARLW